MSNVKIDTDAVINSIRLAEQSSAPSTPASGYGKIYVKSDGLYFVGDDGIEIGPLSANKNESIVRNNGGSYSTNSTSWVDIDSTNLKITMSTRSGRCLVGFIGLATNQNSYYPALFDIAVDGVRLSGADNGFIAAMENNNRSNVSFTAMTGILAEGLHTFSVQWRVPNSSGNGEIYSNLSDAWVPQLWVTEI